jgi:hypothetical protein
MLRISSISVFDAQPVPKTMNVAAKATIIDRAIFADMSVLPNYEFAPKVQPGLTSNIADLARRARILALFGRRYQIISNYGA